MTAWTRILSMIGLAIAIAPAAGAISIPEAKLLADTLPVTLSGKTVTYAEPSFFYIEEDSSCMGIRVERTSHGLTVGMRADVTGEMKTNNTSNERYILATSAVQTAPPNANGTIAPLCMNNKVLGGDAWHVVGTGGQKGVSNSFGLNNIGLLVITWGRFEKVNDTTFTVGEGAGLKIRCTVPGGTFLYSGWQYVVVTGISSIYSLDHSLYSPLLLVRDIKVLRPVEVASTPGTPSGNTSPFVGVDETYTTTGATCSQGHPVEYRFDWGDGGISAWSTSTSASHLWRWTDTATVRVTARCKTHPSVSATSAGLQVTPAIPRVIKVAAGLCHTVVLKNDGTVWAWGRNDYGQLGDGTAISRPYPLPVQGLTGVTAISAGYHHTLALKNDGTVWAWGSNLSGRLGDGTTNNRKNPVKVSELTGIAAISTGGDHSVALEGDGSVWAWGWNYYGQLGDGTTTDRNTPVRVLGLTGATMIWGGIGNHNLALRNDGTIWAWGCNNQGELGNGTVTTRSTTPVQVSGLTGVTAMSAGGYHSVALKSDSTVWAWGNNWEGEFGDGTNICRSTPAQVPVFANVTGIITGRFHTAVLNSNGTVLTCGYNNFGQLGDGTTTDRWTPVQVSGLTGVASIWSGWRHTGVIKGDGTVWAWGYNDYGQLGDGTTNNRLTPVKVSAF